MRSIFKAVSLAAVAFLVACSDKPAAMTQQGDNFVEVWKTPTCGCCAAWVDHLKENGFTVTVNDVSNTDSFRAALGMPQEYGSCHSARVGGYAVEGHVPAEDILRLLDLRPAGVKGIAVPGMPRGSPGMEQPNGAVDPYEVVAFGADGSQSVFSRYTGSQ